MATDPEDVIFASLHENVQSTEIRRVQPEKIRIELRILSTIDRAGQK